MPEQEPLSDDANGLYAALVDHLDYAVLTETTVFLDFEERATAGITFGDHFGPVDVQTRDDGRVTAHVGDSRLAVYPPGETGEASVSFNVPGEGVQHPTDVRLRKGVRFR